MIKYECLKKKYFKLKLRKIWLFSSTYYVHQTVFIALYSLSLWKQGTVCWVVSYIGIVFTIDTMAGGSDPKYIMGIIIYSPWASGFRFDGFTSLQRSITRHDFGSHVNEGYGDYIRNIDTRSTASRKGISYKTGSFTQNV